MAVATAAAMVAAVVAATKTMAQQQWCGAQTTIN
jgi:hypothetical protein